VPARVTGNVAVSTGGGLSTIFCTHGPPAGVGGNGHGAAPLGLADGPVRPARGWPRGPAASGACPGLTCIR